MVEPSQDSISDISLLSPTCERVLGWYEKINSLSLATS